MGLCPASVVRSRFSKSVSLLPQNLMNAILSKFSCRYAGPEEG